ncbi:MAG: tetratricopeptide repeat protein, partial [Chloroflexi bacterium]|nr:tetratricopeptide repeat protein [Chloroflexota bacterium]
MKDIMAVDGDLEALYETNKWKDAQDVSARSLYFLNWINYIGSFVHEGKKQTKMLEAAINGFSEFASGPASSIKRETLFGRALSERELGEYNWAIRDFEVLLNDGATSPDMRQKIQSALNETRRLAKGGKKQRRDEQPSADEMLEKQFAEAKDLFKRSQREKGSSQKKTRERAIGLALGVKESKDTDDSWKKEVDTLLAKELNEDEKLALNPYVPWQNVATFIRKGQYAKAIPELQTVLASNDPRAQRYKEDAQYYLGDALVRAGKLRQAITELETYLNSKPSKNVVNASYLRFKAAESLFAQSQNQANGLLYVNAAKDFIDRDTKNTSQAVHEAHFRLGEYYHGQKNYLKAVDSYQKVSGNADFRFRADFSTLQSYFSLYEQWEEDPKKDLGIKPDDLKKRINT